MLVAISTSCIQLQLKQLYQDPSSWRLLLHNLQDRHHLCMLSDDWISLSFKSSILVGVKLQKMESQSFCEDSDASQTQYPNPGCSVLRAPLYPCQLPPCQFVRRRWKCIAPQEFLCMLLKKHRDTERQQPQRTDIPFVTALCSPLANLELQELQYEKSSLMATMFFRTFVQDPVQKPKSRDRQNCYW